MLAFRAAVSATVVGSGLALANVFVGLGAAPVAKAESCTDGQTKYSSNSDLTYTCVADRFFEGPIIPAGIEVSPCVSGQSFTGATDSRYVFTCVDGQFQVRQQSIPTQTPQTPPITSSASIPGDGVFIVGVDVQPGLYKSAGPTRGSYCWWYRHSTIGTQGSSAGDVIQDGHSAGPQYVKIAPTDATFETEQCSPWVRVN